MYIVTAATALELETFVEKKPVVAEIEEFLTGIGPVETATRLTRYLGSVSGPIDAVINIGVGGAYIRSKDSTAWEGRPTLLDICLAEQEMLGDFGICYDDRIEPFTGKQFSVQNCFSLDQNLVRRAETLLADQGVETFRGTFVTVNGVSGTEKRGAMLAGLYNGLCENMEGAAVARVCEEYGVPLLELRCISNMVEDRNRENWKIREAAHRCGQAAALVVGGLSI